MFDESVKAQLLSIITPFLTWYSYRILRFIYVAAFYQRNELYDPEYLDSYRSSTFGRRWSKILFIDLMGLDHVPWSKLSKKVWDIKLKRKVETIKHPAWTKAINAIMLCILLIILFVYYETNVFPKWIPLITVFGLISLKMTFVIWVNLYEWYIDFAALVAFNPLPKLDYKHAPLYNTLQNVFIREGGFDLVVGFTVFASLIHTTFANLNNTNNISNLEITWKLLRNQLTPVMYLAVMFMLYLGTVFFIVMLYCVAALIILIITTTIFAVSFTEIDKRRDMTGLRRDFCIFMNKIISDKHAEFYLLNTVEDMGIGNKISKMCSNIMYLKSRFVYQWFVKPFAGFFGIAFAVCMGHMWIKSKSLETDLKNKSGRKEIIKNYASLAKSLIIMSAFFYILLLMYRHHI
jgi:hypothetical protein